MTRYRFAPALAGMLLAAMPAAALTPFQAAAVEKVLAGLPADIRPMMQPSLEMVFAGVPDAATADVLASQYLASMGEAAILPDTESDPVEESDYEQTEDDIAFHASQLEAPLKRSWAVNQAYEKALASRQAEWEARITAVKRAAFDKWPHNGLHLGEFRAEPLTAEGEMGAILFESYKGLIEVNLPYDGRYAFDFSGVPGQVDHAPALAELDALFAELERIWATYRDDIRAAFQKTYGDELYGGEGRPPSAKRDAAVDALDLDANTRIIALARELTRTVDYHRTALQEPLLAALRAGQRIHP